MTYLNRRSFLIPAVAAILFLTGCDSDSLGDDTIFLTHEFTADASGEPITFSFSSSEVETGRLQDISCNCTIDVGSFLATQGFSKTDIVSATLQSAELVMLFPISTQLNFMSQAILKLTATGVSPTEVANRPSLPGSRQAQLTVLTNRDISTFLEKESFGAILQIQPNTLTAGQNYEMSIILRVRMEVAGI